MAKQPYPDRRAAGDEPLRQTPNARPLAESAEAWDFGEARAATGAAGPRGAQPVDVRPLTDEAVGAQRPPTWLLQVEGDGQAGPAPAVAPELGVVETSYVEPETTGTLIGRALAPAGLALLMSFGAVGAFAFYKSSGRPPGVPSADPIAVDPAVASASRETELVAPPGTAGTASSIRRGTQRAGLVPGPTAAPRPAAAARPAMASLAPLPAATGEPGVVAEVSAPTPTPPTATTITPPTAATITPAPTPAPAISTAAAASTSGAAPAEAGVSGPPSVATGPAASSTPTESEAPAEPVVVGDLVAEPTAAPSAGTDAVQGTSVAGLVSAEPAEPLDAESEAPPESGSPQLGSFDEALALLLGAGDVFVEGAADAGSPRTTSGDETGDDPGAASGATDGGSAPEAVAAEPFAVPSAGAESSELDALLDGLLATASPQPAVEAPTATEPATDEAAADDAAEWVDPFTLQALEPLEPLASEEPAPAPGEDGSTGTAAAEAGEPVRAVDPTLEQLLGGEGAGAPPEAPSELAPQGAATEEVALEARATEEPASEVTGADELEGTADAGLDPSPGPDVASEGVFDPFAALGALFPPPGGEPEGAQGGAGAQPATVGPVDPAPALPFTAPSAGPAPVGPRLGAVTDTVLLEPVEFAGPSPEPVTAPGAPDPGLDLALEPQPVTVPSGADQEAFSVALDELFAGMRTGPAAAPQGPVVGPVAVGPDPGTTPNTTPSGALPSPGVPLEVVGPVAVEAEQDGPRSVLRRADAETLWTELDVPNSVVNGERFLLTPYTGDVRIVLTGGDAFEGRLHGVGEGRISVDTRLGRMVLDGRRLERIERLAPEGQGPRGVARASNDTSGLEEVRVTTRGGAFTGYLVTRDGNKVTLILREGYRMSVDALTVEPIGSARTTSTLKRLEDRRPTRDVKPR